MDPDDDNPARQFNIAAFPETLRVRLYARATELGVSMSAVAVAVLDENLPPLSDRSAPHG